ncbi:unnamed protein product, partial [Porites evermanni]
VCAHNVHTITQVASQVGIPLAPNKLEGPTTQLVFLDIELFTDASGSLVYGIFYMGHWIANPWPPVLQNRSIQLKELYPIALACLLWGHQWTGKKLLFHCDNQAVMDIWASGSSRDPPIMHL